MIELHGLLEAFRCLDRGHPFDALRLAHIEPPPDGEVEPPACPTCGSPVRPGVVWFGVQCDALLVVGTSGLVYPAAELPWLALERGAKLLEVNPTPIPLSSRAHQSWRSTAAVALPLLAPALAGASATS